MDQTSDLALLIRSRHNFVAVATPEEQRLQELLLRVAGELRVPLYWWSITQGLVACRHSLDKAVPVKPPDGENWKAGELLKYIWHSKEEGIYLLMDFQPYLEEPAVLRALRETVRQLKPGREAILLTGAGLELPPQLDHEVVWFPLALPDDEELGTLLKRVWADVKRQHPVVVDIQRPQLLQLLQNLRGLTLVEAERLLYRVFLDDMRLDESDLQTVIEGKRDALARNSVLEFYPPEIAIGEVGGMERLKSWLEKRGPAFAGDSVQAGLDPPRGLLLLGVQGCGKSLLAKAVAAAWGLPLLRLEPASLYGRFVGQSEQNLQQAFAVSEAMAPSVLWIDEIEKGFSQSGHDADGGTTRRIFGALLAWLQEKKEKVFVVATSNDIEGLPPELLRKGRFDEIFFVDLPAEHVRRQILMIHLLKREQNPDRVDLDQLAKASHGFSGAELEQAVVAALYTAYADKVELNTETLLTELSDTVPLSVTMAEKIEAIRQWASSRAVPAD